METATIQKEKMIDSEKLQAINHKQILDFMEGLCEFSAEVYEAKSGFFWNTITEWFKSYISGSEFSALTPEQKRQSFDQYESMIWLLENIDSFMTKNELGTYN